MFSMSLLYVVAAVKDTAIGTLAKHRLQPKPLKSMQVMIVLLIKLFFKNNNNLIYISYGSIINSDFEETLAIRKRICP